jgi:hypothetical protein
MKKVLVLGKGLLGTAFEKDGFEVWGKDKFYVTKLDALKSSMMFSGLYEDVVEKGYDTIINCIAKIVTRFCEKNFN